MLSKCWKLKFVALFMATWMVLTVAPCQVVLAALVPTEAAVQPRSAQEARGLINSLLSREEVQTQLRLHGISPLEAKARVDSLSDAEAIEAANRIDQFPPGGSTVGVLVGAILIIFLVLLITDLLGLTDVFPFVKKHR